MHLNLNIPPDYEDANEAFGKKLVALVESEDEFDDWEYDFLGHMVDKFEKGENFSDNQIAIINRMFEKYCA